jgi:hypothetical protein
VRSSGSASVCREFRGKEGCDCVGHVMDDGVERRERESESWKTKKC